MNTPRYSARAVERILVALIVVAVVAAPLTLAPANAQAACGATNDYWTSVAGPRFPIGAAAMTDHAVDARDAGTIYATNGKALMKSTNFGCSWAPSYVLGEEAAAPFTPETATIRAIVTSEAVAGHVHLAIDENIVAVTRPHVVSSTNGGTSWFVGDAGLPPAGSFEFMAFAPRAATVGYLGIDLGSGSIDSLYATADGGRTWQARAQNLGGGYTGLAIDPLVPNELWAWGPGGLHHSTDGGASFTAVDDFVGVAAGPVDVFHAPGGPARIMAFLPDRGFMLRSDDGGETWLENYSPGGGAPDSVVHGAFSESVMASSEGDVFAYAAALFSWINVEAPNAGVVDLAVDRASNPSFYGRTARTIEIYRGPTGADITLPEHGFEIPPIYTPDPGSLPEPLVPDPKLAPTKSKVKIAAGKTRRQRYSLAMAKVFTPLDVYLLIDTSESAKRFLRELALTLGEVINELAAAKIDVQIGIGEYRAYPDGDTAEPYRPPCGSTASQLPGARCERNFVYRQVLDVQPVSQALGDALSNLEAAGGGHYNAPAPALIQAATGSGIDLFPPGPELSHDVPKGQGASFREGSFRVVLNATDEPFPMDPYGDDDRPPEQPSIADTVTALNQKDIKQVGLALGPGSVSDLEEVARGTGAVAPSRGVDCDGDGAADLGPEAALVCMFRQGEVDGGSNLVPAIVNLVEAVRSSEPVELTAEGRDGVVANIVPEVYPAVVQERSNVLDFTVTYRCPLALAGERTDIELAARSGQSVLATARTTVVCGPAEKEDFLSIFNLDRVLAVIPLIPAAPPTVPELSSSTQVQSQAQAQGAMATQEQEQPQVAFAHQYKAELREALSRDEDYAMTAFQERTRSEAPARLMFAGAAVLMSLTYAYAASRSSRLRYRFNRR
ncbi:MAG: WD40/YVTN/BNR-like repeat-containing protein [Actinomycetota bacterium]